MHFDRLPQVMRLPLSRAFVPAVFVAACLFSVVGFAQEESLGADDSNGIEFFEEEILPILQARCYECHSHESGKASGGLVLDSRRGWEAGGSSGTAIVPGEPDESLLIEAVRYAGNEMPPDGKLPDDEIALLERWVSIGAPDQRESTHAAADPASLWALEPIEVPEVPPVRNVSWPRTDVDCFLLAKLEEAGLEPAPDADRYTLLRRVTFDLTGLPPTPEEIDAFVNDDSPNAYESVVDRLLASPAFGDHWARHWFDLSCYADLADIDGNVLIRDAWRYRDYVIASFNTDKPLDRFIHEQIAGDLLANDNVEQQREQIIATGFLAIGPWTLQNYIKGQLDADVVDHQIDLVGRTFLGQTISCARCHDHKFDPVPTADYYALAGIFHSTLTTSHAGPGVWSQISHVTLPESSNADAEFELLARDIARQQELLQAERDELQRDVSVQRYSQKVESSSANALTQTVGVAANDAGKTYRVTFLAGPSVWTDGSQATFDGDGILIQLLRPDETVLAFHVHRPTVWSGMADAQQFREDVFEYTGDGLGDVTIHITASDYTGRFSGAIDDVSIMETKSSTVVFQADFNDCQLGTNQGVQPSTGLAVRANCTFPDWTGTGINHSHAVVMTTGVESSDSDVSPSAPNIALQIFSGPPLASEHPRIAEIGVELNRLSQQLESARPGQSLALAVRDVDEPHDIPISRRGDFQSPGEIVPRGFLSAVPVSTRYEISGDRSGRLQLAEWLTDLGNPLTSRVLANRIWHHLFGKGLVRTVDYFGVHGESPSHPELLDYLAVQMRDHDHWSLKQTIRRLVVSRAYRMSSEHDPLGVDVDPDNRLLWRMPRRRLTAESIRDAMLAASGELDPGRGGQSLGLELENNINGLGGNVNPPTWGGRIPDDIQNRRSVYLPLKRARPQGELEILSVFDFPHPSDITGSRPQTTVAIQALFLLNSPFVKQQAQSLSERLAEEQPDDEPLRIQRLYVLTVGRPADYEEVEAALAFLDQCAADLASDGDPAVSREEAWSQLCHAILSSNSFLFRE